MTLNKTSTFFLAGVFLSAALFGGWLAHCSNVYFGGCIVPIAKAGLPCPIYQDVLGFLNFHIKSIKSFSLATPGSSLVFLLFLPILLFYLNLCVISFLRLSFVTILSKKPSSGSIFCSACQGFIRWLSRSENSPNYF